jgi:hypothetical protein
MSPSNRIAEHIVMNEAEVLEEPIAEVKEETTAVADRVEFGGTSPGMDFVEPSAPHEEEIVTTAVAEETTPVPDEVIAREGIEQSAPGLCDAGESELTDPAQPVHDEASAPEVVRQLAPGLCDADMTSGATRAGCRGCHPIAREHRGQ